MDSLTHKNRIPLLSREEVYDIVQYIAEFFPKADYVLEYIQWAQDPSPGYIGNIIFNFDDVSDEVKADYMLILLQYGSILDHYKSNKKR